MGLDDNDQSMNTEEAPPLAANILITPTNILLATTNDTSAPLQTFVPVPANVLAGTAIDPRDHPDTVQYFERVLNQKWCSASHGNILYCALDPSVIQSRNSFTILSRIFMISPPIKRVCGWLLAKKLLDKKGVMEFSQFMSGNNQRCLVGPPSQQRRMIFRCMLLYISLVSCFSVGNKSLVRGYTDGAPHINALRAKWLTLKHTPSTGHTKGEIQVQALLNIIFTSAPFPPQSKYGAIFGASLSKLVYGQKTKWIHFARWLVKHGNIPDIYLLPAQRSDR
jgi:hypothetical protein